MNELKYISLDEQIEKIMSQGLIVSDTPFAKKVLTMHGYYDVINGYREPYIYTDASGNKMYKPNITFEQIYDLFIFDQSIRDAIMISMIDLEDHLKAITADVIGSSFGIDHRSYLKRNNYRDKPVSNPKFSRNEILYTLMKGANYSQKNPVKHYREHYDLVPPWILFKDTYFATFVNLIRFFKKKEREKLIHTLYGEQINQGNIDAYKDLLSDTLFMCLDYRNQTAHGGRTYNYIPKSTLRPFNGVTTLPGLPQLVFALNIFDYKVPVMQIKNAIHAAINEYCSRHHSEEDLLRIEDVTGFKITRHTFVWVNHKTMKYHMDNHCSGSQNLERIHIEEAQEKGYASCKRCCPAK